MIEACLRWREARNRKVYIEYLMLAGVNDDPEQAVVLAEVLKPREAFKVNLIPFNPTPGEFTGSSRRGDRRLPRRPARRGIPTTIRLTRGRESRRCGTSGREPMRRPPWRASAGDGPPARLDRVDRPTQSLSSIRSITCGSTGRSPGPVSVASIASTASMPATTVPKTVCLPSSQEAPPRW